MIIVLVYFNNRWFYNIINGYEEKSFINFCTFKSISEHPNRLHT